MIRVEEAIRYVLPTGRRGGGTGPQTVTAPLPGKITHTAAPAGDIVAVGDTILVIEAIKWRTTS